MWTTKWLNELLTLLCHSLLVESYSGSACEQCLLINKHSWMSSTCCSMLIVRIRFSFIFPVPLIPFNHAYCVRSSLMDHWLSVTYAPVCESWSLSDVVWVSQGTVLSPLSYCSLCTYQCSKSCHLQFLLFTIYSINSS